MSLVQQQQVQYPQQQQQQNAVVKIQAFRQFASQLCAQVVEQLCQEFEREVNFLSNDLVMYRGELVRVAELLSAQIGRERQLHGLLENMAGHHANILNATTQYAGNQPDKAALHEMVEQMFGAHAGVINNTFGGLTQANEITQQHVGAASQLKDQSITAEHELNRILQLISAPPVPTVDPRPTIAPIPQMNQGPYLMSVASTPGLGVLPPMSPPYIGASTPPVTTPVSPYGMNGQQGAPWAAGGFGFQDTGQYRGGPSSPCGGNIMQGQVRTPRKAGVVAPGQQPYGASYA